MHIYTSTVCVSQSYPTSKCLADSLFLPCSGKIGWWPLGQTFSFFFFFFFCWGECVFCVTKENKEWNEALESECSEVCAQVWAGAQILWGRQGRETASVEGKWGAQEEGREKVCRDRYTKLKDPSSIFLPRQLPKWIQGWWQAKWIEYKRDGRK